MEIHYYELNYSGYKRSAEPVLSSEISGSFKKINVLNANSVNFYSLSVLVLAMTGLIFAVAKRGHS